MAEFERRVMEWAKAHPEPVYPTWYDWLKESGMVADVTAGTLSGKTFDPIPTDIAEKLGIKPKEG